jgi:hypothetical protein
MRSEPFIDCIDAFRARGNDRVYLLFREVLAITFVIWVADLVEMVFEDREVGLRESDTKGNVVIGSG